MLYKAFENDSVVTIIILLNFLFILNRFTKNLIYKLQIAF